MIEQHLFRLLTTQGFIEAFWEMCSEYPLSQEKAYEAVDQMHLDTFGKRKYSNFDSFRKTRDQWIKNRK